MLLDECRCCGTAPLRDCGGHKTRKTPSPTTNAARWQQPACWEPATRRRVNPSSPVAVGWLVQILQLDDGSAVVGGGKPYLRT